MKRDDGLNDYTAGDIAAGMALGTHGTQVNGDTCAGVRGAGLPEAGHDVVGRGADLHGDHPLEDRGQPVLVATAVRNREGHGSEYDAAGGEGERSPLQLRSACER